MYNFLLSTTTEMKNRLELVGYYILLVHIVSLSKYMIIRFTLLFLIFCQYVIVMWYKVANVDICFGFMLIEQKNSVFLSFKNSRMSYQKTNIWQSRIHVKLVTM